MKENIMTEKAAERIRKARLKVGLTEKEAAQAIGCSVRTLKRYESGVNTLRMKTNLIWAMHLCYKCSLDDLMTID